MIITFYRMSMNSKGERYNSPVMEVRVRNPPSEAVAIEHAIEEFQKHNKIDDWRKLAQWYEVEL